MQKIREGIGLVCLFILPGGLVGCAEQGDLPITAGVILSVLSLIGASVMMGVHKKITAPDGHPKAVKKEAGKPTPHRISLPSRTGKLKGGADIDIQA